MYKRQVLDEHFHPARRALDGGDVDAGQGARTAVLGRIAQQVLHDAGEQPRVCLLYTSECV